MKTEKSTKPKRKKIVSTFTEPSKTQQHFKDECDVNRIVKKYAGTGIIEHVRSGIPRYVDCSNQTFAEAQMVIAETRSHFERLPADIRKAFDNNAANYVDAHNDPEQAQRLSDLGLIETIPAPEKEVSEPLPTPPAEAAPQGADEPKTEAN